MSHRLLLGLEFDGEYDPRVRAELEQVVAALQAWTTFVPANDAQYLVAQASDDLTAERVVEDSSTIRADFSSAGRARFHTVGAGAGGAGYMLALGAIRELDVRGRMGPPGRDGDASSSSSSSAGGHLHGLMRVLGDGATTTFNLLDIAEYLEHIGVNGSFRDPATFALSADGSQIVFDVAPGAGQIIAAEYVIASM